MSLTTAIDTNILSALLGGEPSAPALADTLQREAYKGSLLIHGAVFAELLTMPKLDERRLAQTLSQVGIQVDWRTDEALWRSAGQAFGRYALRRKSSGGSWPRRLLADFIVGAHAAGQAGQLLTLDPQHYQVGFPDLELVGP